MALSLRSRRLAKVEQHLQRVGAIKTPAEVANEREKLALIVKAAQQVLAIAERDAALPYSERGRSLSPESTRMRLCGDAAVAQRVEDARERLAEAQAALADFEAEHGPDPGAIEREVLAYELNASAQLVERRTCALKTAAAGCRERMAGLASEQREAVFDLAREIYRPLAGSSATEGRRVLEELIAAI
ncbi:hypothetical protein [Roseateles sp.]|uniref:hypothetical protein n=1 Tax=Roseateles sp. TaxID=1971397 RepID=UPI0039596F83